MGLATAPPKIPECKSLFGPVTSTCQYASPRNPVVTEGTSGAIIDVSETKITSACSIFLCFLQKSGKLGDPTSSSPSIRNFTLQFNFPDFTRYSNAFTCINPCPLSSSAPRAQIFPSFTTGSNGSVSHKSTGSTGITSMWAYIITVGALGSIIFSPYVTGFPSVSNTSALSAPAARRISFHFSAALYISGLCSGKDEMDGIRISSKSSSKNRCLWVST
ncbi:hypothetical protein SDC9_122682 [bioreactor metagenome]|uniref:Uncharacterized protein n=1 Tax=bioreactor metagenome TaxID=1076179 RepID=A0A645CFM6_9ZZZZ